MRVSTTQFYRVSANSMSRLQSDVTEQTKYLSSGKRVITAKDAPISNNTLLGFKNELLSVERFTTNVTQAENKNNRQETALKNAQDILLHVQELVIQANNGAYDVEDLKSLALQLRSDFEQLMDVGNAKNETGDYVFSGYQVEKRPFISSPDNVVSYLGDNGSQALQIGPDIRAQTSRSGEEVFLNVANAVGDFLPTYYDNPTPPDPIDPNEPDIYVDRAVVVDRQAFNTAAMPQPISFDFTDADANGVVEITVTDGSAGVVYGPVDYVPGQPIAFNGMEVNIDGDPLPGDQFTLATQKKVSVFETIKAAIDWVDLSATGKVPDPKQHQVDFNHLITQLDNAFGHITAVRAEVGITLKNIDDQSNILQDSEVLLNESRSDIEDLDFARAISYFEQTKFSLEAAQQTFTQVQGLTLFNYI